MHWEVNHLLRQPVLTLIPGDYIYIRLRYVGQRASREKAWDQSRLKDPAHSLLRGETLAVHLRLSGKRGLFGSIVVMPRRETPSEELSLTQTDAGPLRFQYVKVSTVGCNCTRLCV